MLKIDLSGIIFSAAFRLESTLMFSINLNLAFKHYSMAYESLGYLGIDLAERDEGHENRVSLRVLHPCDRCDEKETRHSAELPVCALCRDSDVKCYYPSDTFDPAPAARLHDRAQVHELPVRKAPLDPSLKG